MGTMKLFGVVVLLFFQQCLTEEVPEPTAVYHVARNSSEVPDLTAVYHVGRNSSVENVEFHLRTNALGIPVSIGSNLIDTEDYEFRLDSDSIEMWEHKNWNKVESQSAFWEPFSASVNDYSYHQFYGPVKVNVTLKKCREDYHLLLTPDNSGLGEQSVFYYIRVNTASCGSVDVHKCSRGQFLTGHMPNFIQASSSILSIDGESFNCREIANLNKKGSTMCSPGDLQCADGRNCIPESYVCDGARDCSDGSDEAMCSEGSTMCSPGDLQCADGRNCIPESYVCDGARDCSDGSDEAMCSEDGVKRTYLKQYNIFYSLYLEQHSGLFELRIYNGLLQVGKWEDKASDIMKFYKTAETSYSSHKVQVTSGVSVVLMLEASNINAELMSPAFVPRQKYMCMTTVFHTEDGLSDPIRIYAVDSLLNKIQLGVAGRDLKTGWQSERLILPWPDSIVSKKIHLLFEVTSSPTKIKVERISSCNSEVWEDVMVYSHLKEEHFHDVKMPIVIKQNNTFLKKDNYESDEVLECQHNGVLVQNMCACSPGFAGHRCEQGCGQNRFGQDCEGLCSSHLNECSGLLLCTPSVGCLCAPGYTGDTCEKNCEHGTYGNNCSQTCGKCREGTCDIYTGECSDCQSGYQLPLCKIKYAHTLIAPVVTVQQTFGQVSVVPDLSHITSSSKPMYYSIQYKKDSLVEQWKTHSVYPLSHLQEMVLTGLEYGIHYKIRTVLIDADLNSYEGDDIPTADVQTSCIIPENFDYKLRVISGLMVFNASWEKCVPENTYWCSVEKFEVSWFNRWQWITEFTEKTCFNVTGLLPNTPLKIKVRALTSKGFAPFSPVIKFSTGSDVSGPVRNLRVETVSSNRAKVKWNAPLGFENTQLTYTVNYKCLVQFACQRSCENSSGELQVTESTAFLDSLYPFSQYLISVSAQNNGYFMSAASRNIFLGTNMTEPVEAPEPSGNPPAVTNTSVTAYWKQPDICSAFFVNYVFQLYKASDIQLLKTGSTVDTHATFDNLQPTTNYRVLVFVNTSYGMISSDKYLEINVSTSATVPDKVQNLTVYKQGRHMLGLRWALPINTYGSVVSYTVKYSHAKEIPFRTEKIQPTQCAAWPDMFCHTVTHLQANKLYTVSISARNAEVDADGEAAQVTGVTREKSPGPPENVKLLNTSSNSVLIQWQYPWLANGMIRSFLVTIEETEQFEEEKCCQIYPLNEITVTDEQEYYTSEVSGLHAASTYVISVSAKTVSFGLSQTITVHTLPPHLPVVHVPNIVVSTDDTLTWEPQNQNTVNSSDIYKLLIKGKLLLIMSADTEFNSTGITDETLNKKLNSELTSNFYLASGFTNNDAEIEVGTGEVTDCKWGEINNAPLQPNCTYQLAIVQITEYCGVYNTDIVLSLPFHAK